jgi:hypothetical protein
VTHSPSDSGCGLLLIISSVIAIAALLFPISALPQVSQRTLIAKLLIYGAGRYPTFADTGCALVMWGHTLVCPPPRRPWSFSDDHHADAIDPTAAGKGGLVQIFDRAAAADARISDKCRAVVVKRRHRASAMQGVTGKSLLSATEEQRADLTIVAGSRSQRQGARPLRAPDSRRLER